MNITKSFKQEVADLESGLNSLRAKSKDPNTLARNYDRIIIQIEVQEAGIYFFKYGYNFRNRELKEETKLDSDFENTPEEVEELEKQEVLT